MPVVLTEPFDNFTAAPWTNVNANTTIIAGGRTGTAAQVVGVSANLRYTLAAAAESDVVTVGFWFRLPTLTAAQTLLGLRSDAGATAHTTVSVTAAGALIASNAAGLPAVQSPNGTIVAGTWYLVEVSYRLGDAPNGSVTLRLGGVVVGTAAGIDTKAGGTKTTYDQIRLGPPNGTSGGTVQYDDLYLRNDSTFGVATVPAQVTGLTATQTGTAKVTAWWTAPGDGGSPITGYRVERAPDAAGAPGTWTTLTADTASSATSYVDTAATEGTTWWYRVAARNALGAGAASTPASVPVTVWPGCPFGPSFPEWRILVEAFYNPAPDRTYGSLTYGAEVYGDASGAPGNRWVDITAGAHAVTITHGATDTAAPVPVNELGVSFRDDEGSWWDFAEPARFNLPYVNTPIRVSLIDPAGVFLRLFTGKVQAVADEHDTPPRVVDITAYGNLSSMVTARVGWQRPAESAAARIDALITAAGWTVYDITDPAPNLIADPEPATVVIRDELDRTAASAGLVMSERADGTILFRKWPLEALGTRIDVTDCVEADNAASLLAGDVLYAADTFALLNRAEMTNTAGASASTVDAVSAAKWGDHSQAFGFPATGLAFLDAAAAKLITDRAVARWANIVTHLDAVNVDTSADARWLAVLARLLTGTPLRMDRRGVRPLITDTIVVGWSLSLELDRATAAIYTTTTTPTL